MLDDPENAAAGVGGAESGGRGFIDEGAGPPRRLFRRTRGRGSG